MARRMYDLDNGTENIKVKNIETENFNIDAEFNFTDDDEDLISFTTKEAYFYIPISFPLYTTAERPTVYEGAVIYDKTLKKCILYNGTDWVNLDGTPLGA